ncbi:MAG: T9SS type A sorting domain-containing protein [Flavobacteriales bacterium]|nr:T9SS type A sorting domain-containing protein [Flavobacteriales bacterium]
MIRLTLLIVLTLSTAFCLNAQNQFIRVYGGESYDFGRAIIQTADDGYLIAGTTGSFGLSSAEIMLLKTDPNGYVEWRKYYGGQYADQCESMDLSQDGNLIIGGFTERTGKGYQAYALKLTIDGDTIWSNHFGGEAWDFARQVIPLDDGGYALFGQTYSYGQGKGDFYLLRLNSLGDTLWTRTYGGPELESGESIALASDGGFFLAGYTESFGAGKKDMYVVRTDSDGDTLWTRTYGGVEDDFAYTVVATSDDGFVLGGGTFNNPDNTDGDGDFIVRKSDANGDDVWVRIDNDYGDEYWMDALEDQSGNIVLVGYTSESNFGKEDFRIMRINSDGDWDFVTKNHGTPKNERAFDVKETSDGGYIMVGYTKGFLQRLDDVLVVKTLYNGLSTTDPETGVNEIVIGNDVFAVAFGPNPFSGSPTFFIQGFYDLLPKLNNPITLQIFNIVGQQVHQQGITSSETRLSSDLDSGVYSYQLVSGGMVLATGVAICLK